MPKRLPSDHFCEIRHKRLEVVHQVVQNLLCWNRQYFVQDLHHQMLIA